MADSLYIVAATVTARLTYAAELLFGTLLSLPVKVVPLAELDQIPEDALIINYTHTYLSRACLHIPPEGLLHETGLRTAPPALSWDKSLPRLFPMEQLESLGFDVLSAAFYLATGYAFYQQKGRDAHQRHEEAGLYTVQEGLHSQPYVHWYASHLAGKINPFLQTGVTLPHAGIHFTWDIDNPWAYRHRGLWQQFKGVAGDLKNRGLQSLGRRLQTLAGFRLDPFFTFPLIREVGPVDQTTVFCLMNGNSQWDGFYKASNPAYQRLIRDLRDDGYEVGLHPSYKAGFQPALLKQEKLNLEAILGHPVNHNRQHFLRYRLPDSFHAYQAQGITQDFSLCPVQQCGFLTGMARPYPLFDPNLNKPVGLTVHPTMVMDRSLQQYQGLTPEEGLHTIRDYQARSDRAGGIFTILLHNETLSNEGGWEGWQAPLLEWMAEQNTGNQ